MTIKMVQNNGETITLNFKSCGAIKAFILEKFFVYVCKYTNTSDLYFNYGGC